MASLRPFSSTYKVRSGDSLWWIAQLQYGNGAYWPEIATANQISNPNLILVGQVLTLPEIGDSSSTATPSTPLPQNPDPLWNPYVVARAVRYPAFKYELNKIPVVSGVVPPFAYTFKLKGEITLQSLDTIDEFTVGNTGIGTKYVDLYQATLTLKAKCQLETDKGLQKFLSEPKVKIDFAKHSVSLSYEFGLKSKLPGGPFVSNKYELLLNGFKYTCEVTDIKGEYEGFAFDGKFGYEIEITQQDFSRTIPLPSYVTQPQSDPVKWMDVVMKGAAVALVVGVVAQDIVTWGVGTVDNPIAFATAAALWQGAP